MLDTHELLATRELPGVRTPLFGLADCNNFYASCEAVFRPDWRGQPLVVLGNNDGNIIARSAAAKALGIPMGAALHQVRDRIRQHNIIVCSANFALYGDMSRRVMETLERYTPQLDVYSIDEAFLDLAPIATLPPVQRRAYLAEIHTTVARWTGIPISIGVATTKTLAKAAAKRAKQDPALGGVCVLGEAATSAREALLRDLPVADVWGIGPQRAKLLAGYGIVTAYDLAQADARWVRRRLTVTGARTQLELHGVSCLPLAPAPERRKQLCVSRSFGRPVTTLGDLREAAALFTAHVAERCRAQHTLARRLTLFLTTNPFRREQEAHQYSASVTISLPRATADTLELLAASQQALARLYRPGFTYHKLGVMLGEFTPDALRQGELFSAAELTPAARHREEERSIALMQTLDAINARFGRDTIRPLSTGIAQPWRMKQAWRSPRYTTRWDELAEVH